MKVFVDNDVILDVLLERKQFTYSKRVLDLIENKKIKGYTSPIIFTNTYYLVSKNSNTLNAWDAIKKLRSLFQITPVNQTILDQALTSRFSDFEDAIQYFAARHQKCDCLATRNRKHYLESDILITSPKELIGIIDQSQ